MANNNRKQSGHRAASRRVRLAPNRRLTASEVQALRLKFEPSMEAAPLNTYDDAPPPASPADSRRHNVLTFESRRAGRLLFQPFADLIPYGFRGGVVERQRPVAVSLIG
jgi:hypothetical protein